MRTWIWGGLALLLAAVIIAAQMRRTPERNGRAEEPSAIAKSASGGTGTSSVTDRDVVDAAKLKDTAAAASVPVADPELQAWLKKEARALDYPSVDGDKKREELRKKVSRLTPEQSKQLLQTARTSSASGEKILSTYLMVEGGLNTRKELMEFINDPMDSAGEPHSVEEHNRVRDKSLRIMAIDGLFAQAQRDPSARAALVEQIGTIQDESLRAYAERKLDELDRTQQQ